MPKSLYIDPNKTLRPEEHKIVLPEIPVMQYNKTIKDELGEGHFTKEDLLRIYHDMFVIREFETMLNLVKTTGGYNGVEYNNRRSVRQISGSNKRGPLFRSEQGAEFLCS